MIRKSENLVSLACIYKHIHSAITEFDEIMIFRQITKAFSAEPAKIPGHGFYQYLYQEKDANTVAH